MPPVANQDVVNRYLIQTAIAEKCRVMVEYKNIMKYHADYIVWTSSTAETTEILKTKEIHIEGCTIIVYPWSPYSGSLMAQLDHTPPDCLMVTPTKHPRVNEILENLKVTGRGLPPHVCKCEVIKKVFANICHMHGMDLHKEDISFTFRTYASRESIPATWNVVVCRGTMLYMWPLWITVEGYAPDPPSAEWQLGMCSYNSFLAPLLLHSSL
jgi:hypothetical protein